MRKTTYNDIRKEDIGVSDYNLLIVTATEIETAAFHEIMPETIFRVICGDYTYYLGQVGHYNIIHVQCLQMGSINPGGSTLTIDKALHEWPQVKAVIMIGICFGVDETRQQIGDVVVSSSVKNYETRRMGKKQEIPRGNTYQSDKCLYNAYNNLKLSWENIGIDNIRKDLILGEYISGEQLVDNKKVRNKHLAETPEAKAGEMEGNGMVAACVSARIPWILAKAICDFADGNKGMDKKRKQAIAAASSASCCEAVLGQETAFEGIGIMAVGKHERNTAEVANEDVLFELYKKEFAPYFLRRNIDNLVESYLQGHSLWIYGISGAGKSTSISHALQTLDKSILLVNMAGISPDSTVEEIFEWIYNEVASLVGETAIAPQSYQLCIKAIINLLDKHYAGQQVYVLVEEIPFEGDAFKKFVTGFSSLVVSDKLTGTSAGVHFVLSSIDNPTPHVSGSLQKVKSMVKFLEFERWSTNECMRLIELIKQNFPVPHVLDSSDFITKCGNLPRPIKAVFREAHQIGFKEELDSNNISNILRRL